MKYAYKGAYLLVLLSLLIDPYGGIYAQPFGPERIVIDQSNETISPRSVYTADIDGDGDVDVLSASGNRTLAWHENVDGLGRFSNKNLIDERASGGSILHISDLDGDGDLDLLTDVYNGSRVAWYENVNGKGTYDVLQILSDEIKDIRDVYTADLDGDGDLDVVTASKSPGKLSWLENIDGTGALSEAKLVATLNRDLNAVKTADFDNDGDMDILAVSADTLGLVWYENTDGRGDFQKVHLVSGDSVEVSDAQILDLEGDGDMDIFAIGDGALLWYENTAGTGSFEFYYSLKTPTEYNWCFLAQDVDRDEDADIVIGSFFPSQLLWYEHKRDEKIFIEKPKITTGMRDLDAADFDADGDLDIVFASGIGFDQIAWLQNLDGRGAFGRKSLISTSVKGLRSVHAADIDGDGKNDILSASHLDGNLAWYRQEDESGHFGQQRIIGKSSAKDISTADFDGDGDLDVLAPDIDWYENVNGKGSFSVRHKVSSEVADVRSVKAADIDGDGDEDILAASYLYDEVVWFENTDGLGSFGPKRLIDSLVYFVRSVFPADLDGDGDLDVVSGLSSFSTVVWYENIDGRGQFGPRKSVSKDISAVNSVFAADLDGDGDNDILAASSLDRKIVWFEQLDGNGTFGDQKFITRSTDGSLFVYATDLDSDGDIDVLSASYDDDKIAWYENLDGEGVFEEQVIISNNARGAISVHAADLDTDGDMDVLSGSFDDNKIAWYENKGDQVLVEELPHFTLYQNRPNPLDESTIIGFVVPENTTATLNFYDVSGKLFYFIKGEFVRGYNQVKIDRSELPIFGPAIIYYQLVIDHEQESKKMFLVD